MISLDNYTTLLFDIDDTLLDFQLAQTHAFEQLMSHFNLTYTIEHFQDYQRLNKQLWTEYEQGKLSKETILQTRFPLFFNQFELLVDGKTCDELYRQFLTQGQQLFTHSLEVIQQVSQTHTIAIVTNGVESTQRQRLINNGLSHFFEPYIFISDVIGFQKPDSRFFTHVLDALSITDLSKVLIIGDSLQADILGGQQAGIDTCWVNISQITPTPTIKPTYIISDISELLSPKI